MVYKAGQIFSSLQHGQNVVENDYLTPLFRKYLKKNKISVCDFFSIDRGQIDLENDIE